MRGWREGLMVFYHPWLPAGKPIDAVEAISTPPRSRSREVAPLGLKVTPRSRKVTPLELKVTPRSRKVTPLGLEVAPRSRKVTPLGLEVTPRSRKVAPLELEVAPRSREVTPLRVYVACRKYRAGSGVLRMDEDTTTAAGAWVSGDLVGEQSALFLRHGGPFAFVVIAVG